MSIVYGGASGAVGARRIASALVELTKPNITMLVLLTGVPALLMASAGFPSVPLFLGTCAGIVMASASAASFNHYFDRDIDALMRRTRTRPLPAGVLPPSAALGLGFVLAGAAWVTLLTFANLLAGLIAVSSIIYYAVFYTLLLKRKTPQNIVIGGGAGASAPLIAWVAVTGSIDASATLLAAIVFMWTPPHFWALSLYRRDDYARARIPMLPVTHGEDETRRQIFIYTLLLFPITIVVWWIGLAGWVYGVPATALGALFIALAWRLMRSPSTPRAVALFRYSILYLFALYVFMALDAIVSRWWY